MPNISPLAQIHSDHPAVAPPSEWVTRWAYLIDQNCADVNTESTVLDLACGSGRHMKWLREQGFKVLGVDRDAEALELCRPFGEVLQADLEYSTELSSHSSRATKNPDSLWPLGKRQFNAIIVTNYLWRPLIASILDALKLNGVLIYETFAQGHQTLGRPRRAEFLLNPGELIQICTNLHIVAYEQVLLTSPERFVQRIVAIRAENEVLSPSRYRSTSR